MSRPVLVAYAALINAAGQPLSSFCTLPSDTVINLTHKDDLFDVEFKCSVEVMFKIMSPEAVGIGLFDKFQRILLVYSLEGDPLKRKKGDLVKLTSRFTILKTLGS